MHVAQPLSTVSFVNARMLVELLAMNLIEQRSRWT
jgi:hypothetical protein